MISPTNKMRIEVLMYYATRLFVIFKTLSFFFLVKVKKETASASLEKARSKLV